MRTHSLRITTAAALILATGLGLAACGVDEEPTAGSESKSAVDETASSEGAEPAAAAPESVYDFSNLLVLDGESAPPWFSERGEDVRVELTDELKQLVPEGHDIVVDSFDLHARVFATGVCALDVTVNYAPDGPGVQGFTAGTKELHPGSEFAATELSSDELIWRALGVGQSTDGVIGSPQIVDDFPADDDLTVDTKYATADYTKLTFTKECQDQNYGIASFDFDDDWQCIHDGNSEVGHGWRDAPALPDNCMNSGYAFAGFRVFIAGDDSISIPRSFVRASVSVAGNWVENPEYEEHGND